MIFELSVALKYLIPKKRQLSLTLISIMSVGVIALVVWLTLVFLSFTNGIENNWKKKLTALNAPIQITPTNEYYQSYYYQIDSISESSDYTYKTIGEKLEAQKANPHNPSIDIPIPRSWITPTHNNTVHKDLVKNVFEVLDNLKINSQDYEFSGALFKLHMNHPQSPLFTDWQEFYEHSLTRVAHIISFNHKNPLLPEVLDPPRIADLNHLFFLTQTPQSTLQCKNYDLLQSLLCHTDIHQMQTTTPYFQQLSNLLPEHIHFYVTASTYKGTISQLNIDNHAKRLPHHTGSVYRIKNTLYYTDNINDKPQPIDSDTPLCLSTPISLNILKYTSSNLSFKNLSDISFEVTSSLQGHSLFGTISWHEIEITAADINTKFDTTPEISPPWIYTVNHTLQLPYLGNYAPIVIPQRFQNDGSYIGDMGHFSYGSQTTTSVEEQRLPTIVVGFYDPGVMDVGPPPVFTNHHIVHTLHTQSETLLDPRMTNGIHVYLNDLSQTSQVVDQLQSHFDKQSLSKYWTITPFYEYPFAKSLIEQFQSDKYLLTIIGSIIIIVACSNIITLLIILVNDKKKDIAILSAMGTSKKRIAYIFTLCGGIMGSIGTLIGVITALITLHNINYIVSFLSFLQGHEAFNPAFYGKSLPNTLSTHALIFILIITPLISLLSALIPALKASRIHPSHILRGE